MTCTNISEHDMQVRLGVEMCCDRQAGPRQTLNNTHRKTDTGRSRSLSLFPSTRLIPPFSPFLFSPSLNLTWSCFAAEQWMNGFSLVFISCTNPGFSPEPQPSPEISNAGGSPVPLRQSQCGELCDDFTTALPKHICGCSSVALEHFWDTGCCSVSILKVFVQGCNV